MTGPKVAFQFTISELSGALADLGVLLPLTLAMISINGLNPRAVFFALGAAYLTAAVAYKLPIPVQPLKSFAATALALGVSVSQIVAGAWLMTLAFFLLAASRLDRTIGKLFPKPIIRGIQLGLGLLLIRASWNLIANPGGKWLEVITLGRWEVTASLLLALSTGLLWIAALRFKRSWAALMVIVFGIVVGLVSSTTDVLGNFTASQYSLPIIPNADDFLSAFWLLALPQIPLSLGNAIYATADTAKAYFGDNAGHVTPRRLLGTMVISNVVSASVGSIPVCHGSGGLTAHYRLGARSGGAPLMLGIGFLALGSLSPGNLLSILTLIPFPILAVLLVYVGINHAKLSEDLQAWREWLPAITIATVAILASNLALGFAVGLGAYYVLQIRVGIQERLSMR